MPFCEKRLQATDRQIGVRKPFGICGLAHLQLVSRGRGEALRKILLVTHPMTCLTCFGPIMSSCYRWVDTTVTIHLQWRTQRGLGGRVQTRPPPRNSEGNLKSCQTRLWKLLKNAEFRTPTPQDVWKKGSKILKLPSVRNCFTLAMTNKLVVIINSLKVRKIKKILLYEMKFLVPNNSCLQNPWLGGYRSQIPVISVLCPQLNLLTPPQRIKFLGTPLLICNLQNEWGPVQQRVQLRNNSSPK